VRAGRTHPCRRRRKPRLCRQTEIGPVQLIAVALGPDANFEGRILDELERLEPGHSAGFLMIEHVWARDLKRAIRDAGGVPIGEGFLTPEAVAEVALELAAMAEAVEELEQAESNR
jgi:hypothetical protein